MTAENSIPFTVVDKGGTNEHEIMGVRIEEVYTKEIKPITLPTGKSNRADGAKPNKILDLMKLQIVFTFTGHIEAEDLSKVRALMRTGGTITITYDSVDYVVGISKYSLDRNAGNVNAEIAVVMSCVVGVDL